MIAGLIRPDAGRIVVDGQVLFDSEARIDIPPEKRRLGYVFQDARLFPHQRVQANLLYGYRLIPPAERWMTGGGAPVQPPLQGPSADLGEPR